jgi:hypothetical protein
LSSFGDAPYRFEMLRVKLLVRGFVGQFITVACRLAFPLRDQMILQVLHSMVVTVATAMATTAATTVVAATSTTTINSSGAISNAIVSSNSITI